MKKVRMAVFRARLLALLAVLLVAVPLGAAESVRYFCHSMGRVMAACCCPSAAAAKQTRPRCSPEIRSRDCCERLQPDLTQAAPVVRDKASSAGYAPALLESQSLVVVGAALEADTLVSEPLEARAPPPRGPPLFLANCSFLI
jgi:hypothetical protein